MTDKMIICERCGGDAAYVQEVNEKIKKPHEEIFMWF